MNILRLGKNQKLRKKTNLAFYRFLMNSNSSLVSNSSTLILIKQNCVAFVILVVILPFHAEVIKQGGYSTQLLYFKATYHVI